MFSRACQMAALGGEVAIYECLVFVEFDLLLSPLARVKRFIWFFCKKLHESYTRNWASREKIVVG